MSFREGLGMGLRGAYLSMHRCFNAHFVRYGATADQFVVLTLLAEQDGIMQQELVRRAFSDPNTIVAMLQRLEKRGLIRRTSHKKDGRARCVYLTPKGRAFQQKLYTGAEPLHAQLRCSVDPARYGVVLEGLKQVADAMLLAEAGRRKRRTDSQSLRTKDA